MRKSIIIALVVLWAAPLAQAQTGGSKESPDKSTNGLFTPFRMTSEEVDDVGKRLKEGRDIPIQFEPDMQSPVMIKKAVVRSVLHDASGASHHLIWPLFKLVNKTKQAVTAVRLEFTLADEESKSLGHTFHIFIKPGESKLLGDQYEYFLPFVVAPGSPEKLKVRVGGVEFGSVRVWGLLPASPKMILIDSNPVLLFRPRPSYTERARLNGVQGTVRLRVVIGVTGTVTRVDVLEGLPDGLTEQAIIAAFQLKFRPALINGEPVAYRVTISMDFNLY